MEANNKKKQGVLFFYLIKVWLEKLQ
jgi:hypothetical protein